MEEEKLQQIEELLKHSNIYDGYKIGFYELVSIVKYITRITGYGTLKTLTV